MKKRKTGKLNSSVKSKKEKRWKIFSKENLKWGLGGTVILTFISFWMLENLCKGGFPFGKICLTNILFVILNLPGLLVYGLSQWQNLEISSIDKFLRISIFFNLPIYYILGMGFKKIFKKLKNVYKNFKD